MVKCECERETENKKKKERRGKQKQREDCIQKQRQKIGEVVCEQNAREIETKLVRKRHENRANQVGGEKDW